MASSNLHSLDITETSVTKTLTSDSAETSEHNSTSLGEASTTTTTHCSASASSCSNTVTSSSNCIVGINAHHHHQQVLPTSFITSVTSIASLEAGYQGDGENSRPASRGPDPIASTINLVSVASSHTCRFAIVGYLPFIFI